MSTFNLIHYEVADGVATIALDDPKTGNAYTPALADELVEAFDLADADSGVRVVIFTATGGNFCIGADLSGGGFDTSGLPAEFDENWKEPAGRCALRIYEMNKPVIAAVRGAAVGGGSTIVLPADYRLASTDARFGFVFSRRGIYPEGASAWFLPKLVGLGTAMDWMISGRVFDAAEAQAAGLVHSLHEPDDVLDAARRLARGLVENTAAVSVAVLRQMIYRLAFQESPYPMQRVDSRLVFEIGANRDAAEGVASFLERRKPKFPQTIPSDLPGWLPWRHT
ncbi:enoyl-CoA hydratase-related protein [Streptomyces europaeiscabiei]|uniref:enoyl-CoA hydratase-related protein n=1 Tax=Streptomyces europaeiscabiei TaxID=146819 RepID=UPI002E171DCC|nr:enoyl-CoA hydratase-related protein [Streptomyces europaeiscabiei]